MNEVTSTNYQLWEQFQNNSDVDSFLRDVKLAQDFYNGKQYSSPARLNEPRVVMNICLFGANIKASKVVGTPTYIRYTSDNDNISCVKLERFDEYNLSKLKAKQEYFQSALNGYNDGIDITMYRWDQFDTTYKGIYKGGLVLEHIRPKDFAVANVSLKEIQNQKWIMYRSFEECQYVRNLCEDKERAKYIQPDDFKDGENSSEDSINYGQVKLYTRFFRVDGEVFFMCSTKDVDLFKFPKALNPRLNKKIAERIKIKPIQSDELVRDYEMDYEDIMLPYLDPKKWSEEEYMEDKEKFSLYPVATFVPFVINGKYFGRSDTRQLIPTQQGINYSINLMLKCTQNSAYQKIFAKEGALQGQVITNEPGEIIIDHTKMTNGWGLKLAESQPVPNSLFDNAERLLGMTRVVNGFNEVFDGSMSNQDISGYAVQQMIKQANTSIEQQQRIFWGFLGDQAAIRLQFYKHYVDKARYTYEMSDALVSKQGQSLEELKKLQKEKGQLEIGDIELPEEVKKIVVEEISGDELYGSNFDINIEVEQGLVDSKLAESQLWDTLIMNGGIQSMTPEMLEMYLEANPVISPRSKQALSYIVEKQKHEEIAKLRGELQEVTGKLVEAADIINKLTTQNKGLGAYNQNLQKEFSGKLEAQNKIISTQNLELQKYLGSASEGEVKSNNARGINGTKIIN